MRSLTQSFFALLLVLTILPSVSQAARSRKKAAKAPTSSEVALPVAQSEVDMDAYLPELADDAPVSIEIGISSWAPSDFRRGSYSGANQEFGSGTYPMLSINRLAPISDKLYRAFSKFGLSVSSLERNVDISRIGGSLQATQQMNLFSARIGGEYRTRTFAADLIEPFVGLAVLPTLGLASRSELEDKVNTVGVPFEASAGVSFYPSFLPGPIFGARRSSIGLGLQYLFGSVGGSRVDGLGAQGSLRVDL